MSFIPKAAGALAGGVVGSQLLGGGGVKGALGAATGGIIGSQLLGGGGGRKPMDERTSTAGYRSGRGASSLSV